MRAIERKTVNIKCRGVQAPVNEGISAKQRLFVQRRRINSAAINAGGQAPDAAIIFTDKLVQYVDLLAQHGADLVLLESVMDQGEFFTNKSLPMSRKK